MTVQELIDKLNKVENKNADIWLEFYDEWNELVTTDQLSIVYSLCDNEVWLSEDAENVREEHRIEY